MRKDYEKPFDIMALDENYNLVSLVVYNKLQWTRKCLEPGIFSVELTTEQYDNSWVYIYTPSRRELGRISQVNMQLKNNLVVVTVSGQFIEADLDKMVVYPKPASEYSVSAPHSSIINGPAWLGQSGTADSVAMAFFNGFKSITYMGYDVGDYSGTTLKERTYTLDIESGTIDTEHGEYVRAEHNRNGEYLGKKLSQILKFSHAFYEVNYDYQTNVKTLDIRHGRNLTNNNNEGNNPIVFSSQNGTIASAGIVKSNTGTKDNVVAFRKDETTTDVLVNGYDSSTGRFLSYNSLPQTFDYPDDHDFRVAALQANTNILGDHEDKVNISLNIFSGAYDYIVDYDIGDIVTVKVPEIDLDIDVQIIACYEVVQDGVWSIDLEFGTPIKRRQL